MPTCLKDGVTGEKPFRLHVFGASVSVLCTMFIVVALCSRPSHSSENMISTSRKYIIWANLCNVMFNIVALTTSVDLYYHPNSGHDRVHMSLMLGWVSCAMLTVFWSFALYNNTYYMLSLPRMKGNINVLMVTTRHKLQSHMNAATRVALALMLTFVISCVIFFIFTDRSSREDNFPNLFVGFFIVFLFLDILLLCLLVRVSLSVRTLASMPLFANRVYICIIVTLFSVGWLLVVFSQAMRFGSTSSLTENSDCFYFWFNKALLPPVILSVQITSIAILTPRMVCGAFSLCCRFLSKVCSACADGADKYGVFLDQSVACCKESFLQYQSVPSVAAARVSPSMTARPNSMISSDGDAVMMDRLEELFEYMEIEPVIIPPQFIEVSPTPVAAGGFAQIHKGVFAGKRVAVKKVFTQFSEGKLDEFTHEVRMLNLLKGDPHIILLHGVSIQMEQDISTLLIVLEWCPLSLNALLYDTQTLSRKSSSSLMPWLGTKSTPEIHTPAIDPQLFLSIAKQLLNAVVMLHFKGVVHRDIKPDNILFSDPVHPESSMKLCDFGTSLTTTEGRCSQQANLGGLSPFYSPPEAIHVPSLQSFSTISTTVIEPQPNRDYDGRKFDMFSIGIVLWEVWSKEKPVLARLSSDLSVPDLSSEPMDALNKVVAGYRPDISKEGPFGHMSPALLGLIENMWDPNPDQRPSAAEAKVVVESAEVAKFIHLAQSLWTESFTETSEIDEEYGETELKPSLMGRVDSPLKEMLISKTSDISYSAP